MNEDDCEYLVQSVLDGIWKFASDSALLSTR